MTLELNEQEHQYLLNVLLDRPVKESLALVLKITNQKLVPTDVQATPPTPALRSAG